MDEELEMSLEIAQESMSETIEHLRRELLKISTG